MLFIAICLPVAVQVVESPLITINCGNTFNVTGSKIPAPLLSLAHALRANRGAHQFRVIWSVSAPNTPDSCTAFYDRHAKVLRFFSKEEVGGLGNENIPAQYTRWRLKNVSEVMILRLSRLHQQNTEGADDSFFSELTRFGAKRF